MKHLRHKQHRPKSNWRSLEKFLQSFKQQNGREITYQEFQKLMNSH